MKPSDCWTVPMHPKYHAIQHELGEEEFEKRYGIDLYKEAKDFWKQSPYRKDLDG